MNALLLDVYYQTATTLTACTTHCAPAARAHFSWALRHYGTTPHAPKSTDSHHMPETSKCCCLSQLINVKVLEFFLKISGNIWQKKNNFGIDKHADFNHKYNFVNVNKLLTFLRRFFAEPISWVSPTHDFFYKKNEKENLPPFQFLQKL